MGARTENSIVSLAEVLNIMRLAYYRGDQWLDDDEYVVGSEVTSDYPTNGTVILESLTRGDYNLGKQIVLYFRDWIRGDATIGLTQAEQNALSNSSDPDIQSAWTKIQQAETRNGFVKLPKLVDFSGALEIISSNSGGTP